MWIWNLFKYSEIMKTQNILPTFYCKFEMLYKINDFIMDPKIRIDENAEVLAASNNIN